MAAAFATQAASCARRHDTTHAAFHGCIDWHSSVHAVWALTVAHRRQPGPLTRAEAERDLTPGQLAKEQAYLEQRPRFELPYGRAWFLRLAVERRRNGLDGRLDALVEVVAESLVRHYRASPPDPFARDYENAAWAYINLLAYGRAFARQDIVAFVESGARKHFMQGSLSCTPRDEGDGFLATCAAWAWLASEVLTKDAFDLWMAAWSADYLRLTPIAAPTSAHLYGMNFSRAWGLAAIYRKTGDDRARDAYCRHVRQGYRDWIARKDDYLAVGHWVAQFGMLALEQGNVDGWCGRR